MSINWNTLPMVLPDGQLMPHLSARMRTGMIDAVFEGAGGFDRMLAWVTKNDDNYGQFLTKIWGKGAVKAPSLDSAEVILDSIAQGNAAKDITPINMTAADILRDRLDAIARRAPGIVDAEPAD